jgi:cbb3-type cytochrome oxidase subunit 1
LSTETETTSTPPPGDVEAVARQSLLIGVALLALAALMHFTAWISLVFPPIFQDWGMFQFGRLEPMANAVLGFGAVYFINVGALYLLLPRLTGATIRDVALARFNTLWTLLVGVVSVLAVGVGLGDGRQGFEFPLILDAIYLTTTFVPLWIGWKALQERTEPGIYPTLWALMGGFVALGVALIAANFPLTEATGGWIQVAFGQGLVQWTWVIGIGVGILWYVVPKASGRPLFSRQLAQMTFFSLLLPPMFAGLAGLAFGPVPDWAEVIGVAFRFSLIVPAITVPTLVIQTMRGVDKAVVASSPSLRAAVAGSWLLAAGGVVTGLSAFPFVQSVVGFTTFADGTTALLTGAAVLFAAAFVYHEYPGLVDRPLFSTTLALDHVRLVLWGSALSALFLWYAGVYAGAGFRGGTLGGLWTAVGDGFTEAAGGSVPLYMLSLLGMALVTAGQVAFLLNLIRTGRGEATPEPDEAEEVAA